MDKGDPLSMFFLHVGYVQGALERPEVQAALRARGWEPYLQMDEAKRVLRAIARAAYVDPVTPPEDHHQAE